MTDIKLSKRMQAVADMVDESKIVDIGCDHAFVSMYMIQAKKADRVIAMDVKKGPLDIAKNNIFDYGMADLIDVRLSNGFDKLSVGEADCAIIAGMGGGLMVDILTRGKPHIDAGIHLVLQPQSEPWKVREYLCSIGYEIVKEDMVEEDDKFYVIIKAIPAIEDIKTYSMVELTYGRILLKLKHPVLIRYIQKNRDKNIELFNKLEHIHTDKSFSRQNNLKEEILFDEEALKLLA